MTASGAGTCGADDNQAQAGHLIGFDLAQITSAENRSNPQPGDPQPPLTATGSPHVAGVLAPTLTASWGTNHGAPGHGGKDDAVLAVAYALTAHHGRNADNADNADNWVTHALTAEGADASEDGTGRGTPLVAFGHQDSTVAASDDGINSTLRRGGGGGGGVADGTAVRRLTPVECERLQGFPDDWTAGQSDSTRYRQLGNAVAVPCLTWVTQRIAAAQHRIDHDRQEH